MSVKKRIDKIEKAIVVKGLKDKIKILIDRCFVETEVIVYDDDGERQKDRTEFILDEEKLIRELLKLLSSLKN